MAGRSEFLSTTGTEHECLASKRLNALCGECVWFFGDDDPGDDVGQGADSGKNDEECGEDANKVEIPAIMKREACADSGDHAVGARAREFAGEMERIGERSGYGIDAGSAGRTETGGWFQLLSAM